ncbi:MAG: hypothetical protein HY080_11600 [Gammaproteobacteria bacterium]|nr:hypothetical protein [Gammaproteobacteria bacterium]
MSSLTPICRKLLRAMAFANHVGSPSDFYRLLCVQNFEASAPIAPPRQQSLQPRPQSSALSLIKAA